MCIYPSLYPSVDPSIYLSTQKPRYTDARHAKPSRPQPYSVQHAPTLALAACAHPRTRPHRGRRAGTPSATRCRSWTRVRTGCSSLPRFSAHICARTRPRLRRDSPMSAPGPAHICAGTRPHLHRDRPTSAPGCAAAGVGRVDDGRARPRARHGRRHAGKKSRARCGGDCDVYSPAMLSMALRCYL